MPDSPTRLNRLEYLFPCSCHMGEKEERNHPHEGARQCCSPSPSGVLQRSSSFQFQLRPCRSTLAEAAGEASNHTPPSSVASHAFPLPCPALDGVCTRIASWPGKNRITRSYCFSRTSMLLENFLAAFISFL